MEWKHYSTARDNVNINVTTEAAPSAQNFVKFCFVNARIRNKFQDLEELVCMEEYDVIGVTNRGLTQ